MSLFKYFHSAYSNFFRMDGVVWRDVPTERIEDFQQHIMMVLIR